MRYLQHLICHKHTIDPAQTVAMDETAVYFSSSHETTVEITNTSSVAVKGTGFDSQRITCILAIRPNGTLLKPLLILKGTEDGVFVECNGVLVTKTEKAWITEKSCISWLKRAFPSTFFNKKSKDDEYTKMIVWDACPVHRANNIKKF